MKLLYTPNSPYSRVTRILALENNISMEFVQVHVRELVDELLCYNPAAKVPSLVIDKYTVLSDTRLICEYFESISHSGFTSVIANLKGRQWEGFMGGFLDGVAVLIREIRRDVADQSPGIITLEKQRIERCLQYVEKQYNLNIHDLNYASVMLVSALELIDTRIGRQWRDKNVRLSDWFNNMACHPNIIATKPMEH